MRNIFTIVFLGHLLAIQVAWAEGGKIWAVAEKRYISEKTLLKSLKRSKNILLGLRQDNPLHHKRAAKIIENLARMGQNPVLLLSNVERNKQNAFTIFTQRHEKSEKTYDATGLDMLLDWSHSGQPNWAVARPVFDVAMLKKRPLKAVNFSRYEIGELHRNGLTGLPKDIKSDLLPLLKIKTPVSDQLPKIYCDRLPPEVLAKFTMIRRARNGLFALAMAETHEGTAVLIAAQKHMDKDSGIPPYLNKLGLRGKYVSLSFVETGQDVQDGQVDFIWYTEKISRPRPCQHHLTN